MGPSRFLIESAPGAWSSELHSRLSLYVICPIPPARWKSALSTGNPGSWNQQRQNGICDGQGFSEEGEAGEVGVWWAGNDASVLCTAVPSGMAGR